MLPPALLALALAQGEAPLPDAREIIERLLRPFPARLQANRYAVSLTARVKYSKTGKVEPIWQNDAFSARDETDVGNDPESFFDRDEQVQERLATNFARRMVSAMLEAF